VTLTRNAGDNLDLKANGTVSNIKFQYVQAGSTFGSITASLAWG